MRSPETGADPRDTDLELAIEERVKGIESGKYRASTEHVLAEFAQWLQREHDVQSLTHLTATDCRRYAQHLRDRTRDTDATLSASSATTYYAYVRAFLGWCVRDGRMDTNPAAQNIATEELPEESDRPDRQFWKERERTAFLAFVDQRVDESFDDESTVSQHRAYRDRALVYVLALSGVRGAEVFNAPQDNQRNGLRWTDVDLENGTLEVLGKSRTYQHVPLPERVCTALKRHKRVAKPPSEDLFVFPTEHAPSKYAAVRDQIAGADDLLGETDISKLIRDHEIVIPSISTAGARNLMQRLCEEAGVEIDGEYLKPHGGRRGLGHELYSKGHAELAQTTLRHASIETTHEAYSDIQAKETAKRVDEVLHSSPKYDST
jgi:integrase